MSATATLSAAPRHTNLQGKRTNSLGWAKSDCHNCSSVRRYCDRRRPRCSACLADGIICSGYVQELNWDRGRPFSAGKRQRVSPAEQPSSNAKTNLARPTSFVFVDQSQSDTSKQKKSRRTSKSDVSSSTSTGPISTKDAGASPAQWEPFQQ